MSEPALSRLQILKLIQDRKVSAEVGRILLEELSPPAASASTAAPDVAVIGISGRFPDARNIDELWANLSAGRDSVREIPADRWDVAQHWNPDPLAPNKTYSKWGAILDDIDQFDPAFFSMSPREARVMDPQQRLFLMEAWNALEHAGYADRTLDGSDCQVYVGVGSGDYGKLIQQRGVPSEGHAFTGTHPAVLASRLSYHLNLMGTTAAIDTSCSSSLMAVHLACEAIREGKCEMAVAGGVAVLVTPELHILTSKSGMLSPRGRCRVFDDGADGFVTGEAVAAVVLKSLPRALRDGDHIDGVIAGSAANQDGKTSGITAPSGPAQTALEVATYRRFGIDPSCIGYVECHGTGTRLGDPIEVNALAQAFAQFTSKRAYCAVGSIKSNFGHTLTAAGIVGLIKVLLCLKHRTLVPSIHVEKQNRYIHFDDSPFFVNTELVPWAAPSGSPRTAAVSSFGFSGTNVHAVVREAPPAPPRSSHPATERVIAISGATDSALRDKVAALSTWIGSSGQDHAWRDISYTLAVGRTHFPIRAAFVARGPEELVEQLRAWSEHGAAPRSGAHDLEEVADAYRAGKPVDWSSLFTGEPCHRVALPTYPFARERYWVPEVGDAPGVEIASPRRAGAKAALVAGEEVAIHSEIRADDPIVRDHTVRGKPLLPAAGHLSIVHAALRDLWGDVPVTLSRVVWLRPLFVEARERVEVACTPMADGRITFQVRTIGPDGAAQVHSRGEARSGADAAGPISIDEIRARCRRTLDAGTLYARFASDGIAYGRHFATVTHVWHGDNEVLAALAHDGPSDVIPAGMLDGAVQSVAILEWDKPGVYVPFTMERVHVIRAIPAEAYAHVRKTKAGETQLAIVDASGAPCLVIDALSYRELKEPVPMSFYVPQWRKAEEVKPDPCAARRVLIMTPPHASRLAQLLTERHVGAVVSTVQISVDDNTAALAAVEQLPAPDRIYFLGGIDDGPIDIASLEALERSQALGVRALFRVVKTLLERGGGARPLELTVVTNDVHAIATGDEARPHAASLFGLCKSLAKEHPSWRVSCLDVAAGELAGETAGAVADAIVAEAPGPRGDEVVLRRNQRHVRTLRRVEVPAVTVAPFRPRGTYLILGGAGGIGSELALHLARKAQARLVLLGRRSRTAAIDGKLAAIEAAGGEAIYLQVDATDDVAMTAAVAAATQRFGPIHGAVHSALVLRDGLLENMSEETFMSALAPKVRGAVVMMRALRHEPLDFFLFFSSAQSFSGNPGQSNYAASCTFEDAFASHLRIAGQPVHIVNWGYWGEIGIVAKPEYRRRMRAMGVHSIGVEEGMATIDAILAHGIAQVMPLRAERHVLEKFGVMLDEPAAGIEAPTATWDPMAGRGTGPAPDIARLQTAHAELDALGVRMAVGAIQEMGALRRPEESHSAQDLEHELRIAPAFQRLWPALIELFAEAGYLRRSGDAWLTTSAVEGITRPSLSQDTQRLVASYPEVKAHAELLSTCVREFPRVLRGDVPPTEVMFPRSSSALVEGIYRGNPLSDYYNAVVARAVLAYAESHPAPARIRILEVGAGTGGTTESVLATLAPHRDRLEYVYSDLSLGFLQHGRQRFGKSHPGFTCKRLDIERDPGEQGFTDGTYDIVVAANVLHATARLRDALRHVQRLIRGDGWLVLSETTARSPFATLTFGLLDGWWRFADELRQPGSPLADAPTWRRLLHDEGFARVAILEPERRSELPLAQHVLIAEREQSAARTAVALPAPEPAPESDASARPVPAAPAAISEHRPREPRAPVAATQAKSARAGVARALAESISATLGRDDADLDPDKSFTDYGVDSIILVEIVNTLNERLGISLKTTALFDYPTLGELTQHVCDELGPEVPESNGHAAPGIGPEPVDRELALLEKLAAGGLSVDDAQALLHQT